MFVGGLHDIAVLIEHTYLYSFVVRHVQIQILYY